MLPLPPVPPLDAPGQVFDFLVGQHIAAPTCRQLLYITVVTSPAVQFTLSTLPKYWSEPTEPSTLPAAG